MNEFNIDIAWFDDINTLRSTYKKIISDGYNKVKKVYNELDSSDYVQSESTNEIMAALEISLKYHEKINIETIKLFDEIGKVNKYLSEIQKHSIYKGLDD